jgi:hypothetical protein
LPPNAPLQPVSATAADLRLTCDCRRISRSVDPFRLLVRW